MLRKIFYFSLLSILLYSCQQQNDENHYGGLENNEDSPTQYIDPDEDNNGDTGEENDLEYEGEEEVPSEDEESSEDEEQVVPPKLEEEEAENDIPPGHVNINTGDFIGRWNGISDEFTFEKKITTLDYVDGDTGSYYFTDLGHSQLKLFVNLPNEVSRIEIIGRGLSKEAKYSMMTHWWQLLLTMNPEKEPHEIDMALTELNIGANADLSRLTKDKITFGDQLFFIKSSDNDYKFILTFLENKPNGEDGGDST
ncbi:MAG: hypothetical protein LRY73_04925 [Bacillus sp. (in: Bacteria)]|nr:hypothetical protein [Bacillus sp. (in: firmicutes)]